jgi:hypothetical protein
MDRDALTPTYIGFGVSTTKKETSMHSFDPEIAKKVGVNAAVIYQNIVWWTQKNAANNKHHHDGRHWTYNSIKAFDVLFPYLTTAQIRRALEKLETSGLLLSGTFNKIGYDRTKWYCPSEQIHLSEIANGFVRNRQPIPVSKPDIKPVDKHIDHFDDFWSAYPRKIGRVNARKAFEKAMRIATIDEISAGLNSQLDILKSKEQKFIPHPSTWLNGERWNDEPDHNAPRNGTHARADRPGAGMAQAFAAVAERLSRNPEEGGGGGGGFI